jgi:hypothetical protein
LSSEFETGLYQGILIGVIVTLVGQFIQILYSELRDWMKEGKQAKIRRAKAYTRLFAILERFGVNASTTQLTISAQDFKELESAVEDNYDVLYDETLQEWRNRTVLGGADPIRITAGRFFGDVSDHYHRLDRRNPYHNLDT